jgi:O-methyltransferase
MADQAVANTRPSRRQYPPGYGIVEPVANYRPWEISPEFQSIYRQIKEHTMVDVFRLWTLWYLCSELPAGELLEVGSWRGGSGALIASAVAGSSRTVYLADTFSGVVKAGKRDTYYTGGEHANTSPRRVRGLLKRMGLNNVKLLVGVFPEDTAGRISEERFAFCHIDVDVYRSAKDTFQWVWPRLTPGGVVVFDDYGFYGCEGVTSFVEELRATEPTDGDRFVVIPSLSGQAILVRSGG